MPTTVVYQTYRGYAEHGDATVTCWNEALGQHFPMDGLLWRQNMDEDPNFDAGGIVLASEDDSLIGLAVARVCRVPLGDSGTRPGHGWINSLAVRPPYRRRGIGSELLRRAEEYLRSLRVKTVHVGGDPGHFFPGVPSEVAGAGDFFGAVGYLPQGEPCWDLRSDISKFVAPPLVERVMARNLAFRFTPCSNRHVPALLEFLKSTFPGRWLYETQLRLEKERSPQDIVLLLIGNRVVGFAHTFRKASGRIGPSIYWRKLLGPHYGGLGPMGVSRDVRGKGLGFALLCDAIEHLRKTGVVHMAVDWTVLTRFYGEAGFKKWKEYQSYSRAIQTS